MRSERGLESKTGGRAATSGVIPGDVAISVGDPKSELPEGWTWRLLTDLARLETGHTPSRRHPEYWGGSVPWIGIRDATANHGKTIFGTAQYTNELGIRNSSARILPANTVCLSRTASVGYVVVMGVPMSTSQDFVNWVCGPELDHRYLKYILLAERSSFLRFASGTTHQTIYFPEVKAFHVAVPSLDVQRQVADALGELDDRIDVLSQMNVTLESMALATFKSWFIDFDPVHLKAQGQEPAGIDAATAALFPNSVQESELGPIPKGWTAGSLADLAVLNARSWNSRTAPEEVAYVDLAGVKANVFDRPQRYGFADAPSRARRELRDGDTLVGTVRPGNGSFGFVSEPEVGLTGSTGFAVLSPGDPSSTSFIYLCATRRENIERLSALADGGAYPAVRPEVVHRTPCVIPTAEVLQAFEAFASPLLRKEAANAKRAALLADIRDTMLPRLLSGRLRLPEWQQEVEEAVT
jgi:type I restriction enzyme S subunit